jgi:4-carboxymuconolactone decarboxylase
LIVDSLSKEQVMSEKIDQRGVDVVKDMLSPEAAEGMLNPRPGAFAPEMGLLSINTVFAHLWTRPGLSRRDRSLITVAALIATRASHELRYHFPIAIKNGVTKEELEELIYHLTGYVGFPPAASASQLANELFGDGPGPDHAKTIR